ncbi:hypothetical protein BS50DRAFT_626929 [Corynespora cassiicola Philippines]|uniref:RNase III domain-containing protein n=1 Tax=Corynespora cassiicola Philippines TaxID=1448308 RepID=A0A2T2N1X3_CORCC|nr:hypothetical protein BS50DRAFT_626929 [Corynespora cassiicola Philippines]
MAFGYVQAQIHYDFVNTTLLQSSLIAPHRSDEEKQYYHGNRDLAKLGGYAVDMVATRNAMVGEGQTNREANRHQWFKSKAKRASVCENLGIDEHIIKSPRQKNQKPSTVVLANVLSAIVGAVWKDLEEQNRSVADTLNQLSEILCHLDAIVPTVSVDRSFTTDGSVARDDGAHLNVETLNFHTEQVFPANQYERIVDIDARLYAHRDIQFESEFLLQDLGQGIPIFNAELGTAGNLTSGATPLSSDQIYAQQEAIDSREGYDDNVVSTQRVVVLGKRKRQADLEAALRKGSLFSRLLQEERTKLDTIPYPTRTELDVLLDHSKIGEFSVDLSQVVQLRSLYLIIGSSGSLIEFKGQLSRARDRTLAQPLRLNLCITERIKEVCRLDDQETLCVLTRRFHVLRIFESESEILRQENAITIETPSTFKTGHKGQSGNPVAIQEATITNSLLSKARPDLKEGSDEFERLRRRLSELRRLARRLQMLVQSYGPGILALLPCGPTYSELALTDRTLLSIGERNFRKLSDLIWQQQGPILKELSGAIAPALLALIDGSLIHEDYYPIEQTAVDILENLPKGCPEVMRYLKGEAQDFSYNESLRLA